MRSWQCAGKDLKRRHQFYPLAKPAVADEAPIGAAPSVLNADVREEPFAEWWTAYGGESDPESGVIYFPPIEFERCPFACSKCDGEENVERRAFVGSM